MGEEIMIESIVLKNYRQFKTLEVNCNKDKNIFIGDNGAGKSTILEALKFVLSGSFSGIGKIGIHNLFNCKVIDDYLAAYLDDKDTELPIIMVEVYLDAQNEKVKDIFKLEGKHNSKNQKLYGMRLLIELDEDYRADFYSCLEDNQNVFPFEYYTIRYSTFSDETYNSFKKPFKYKWEFINTSEINVEIALKHYVTHIFESVTEEGDRARIFNGLRTKSKEYIGELYSKNRIKEGEYRIDVDGVYSSDICNFLTVKKDNIDINSLGQGEKLLLSLFKYEETQDIDVLLIEEPENHLSFSNMQLLIQLLQNLTCAQSFLSTHSNMVATKLELRKCFILSNNKITKLNQLDRDTEKFFVKLTNQNVLNFILSSKVILVEGAAEYILIDDMYKKFTDNNSSLYDDKITLISCNGLSFERYLAISTLIDNKVAVITDNDHDYNHKVLEKYSGYDVNFIKAFSDENNDRYTFEVCLFNDNQEWLETNKISSSEDIQAFLLNQKAEAAYRISSKLSCENESKFIIPKYIKEAFEWIKE